MKLLFISYENFLLEITLFVHQLHTKSFGWTLSCFMHDLPLSILSLHQMTPLHLAAESAHTKTVNYLCVEGANINIQDNDGVNSNSLHFNSVQLLFENSSSKDPGIAYSTQMGLRRIITIINSPTKTSSKVDTCIAIILVFYTTKSQC